MKVGFIHLGCSKNLVDTEKLISMFKQNKYEIENDEKKADIIVINTCGFIQSAKEEAINTILEMAEYKKVNCKKLIVLGCLPQRYKEELEKEIPEVDLWIKYKEYNTLWEQIENTINGNNVENENNINDLNEYRDRVITTGKHFAYLKIADGCDNRCTYCAIPYIRGNQISRKLEDLVEEAKDLVNKGYKELILIAQDTTKYGRDIYGEPKLVELLKELCKIEELDWIRFLYAYPETITDELIEIVKSNDKICNYFDIPIQHISDNVLKTMNRQSTGRSIRSVIRKLRKNIPNVIIRTTVMVGFPGETEENFEELYKYIEKVKFDKLGCFAYSKEEGTPAARMKNQNYKMVKTKRYNQIMKLQKEVSNENMKNHIGKELKIIIENISFDKKYYVGRSYMDVPDIDGVVYVKIQDNDTYGIGDYVIAKVTSSDEYDLVCD